MKSFKQFLEEAEFKPAFSHKANKTFFNNIKVMSEVYEKMKAGKPLNQREQYWFKGRDEKSIEEELVELITKILRNAILIGSKKKINPDKAEFHKMFDLKKIAMDNLDKWKKKTSAKEVLGGMVTQYLEKNGLNEEYLIEAINEEIIGILEETLSESKYEVEVAVRDASKANAIAKDMFRGTYEQDGSNSFIFKKESDLEDFKNELEAQRIEVI